VLCPSSWGFFFLGGEAAKGKKLWIFPKQKKLGPPSYPPGFGLKGEVKAGIEKN